MSRSRYGYVRVSTAGQRDGNSIEDQTKLILDKYPDAEIIVEAYSGAKERPLFSNLVSRAKSGDTIIVTKLDRFCRTTKEGLQYIDELREKGVDIHILNMGLIENTPMGKLIITTLLAFAEFERSSIIERTQSGKAIAKQREGFTEGRPRIETDDFGKYYEKVENNKMTVSEAASKLGISRRTWYRRCKTMNLGRCTI